MPKRKRAQEIKKHGALVLPYVEPEQKPAIVTDDDLIRLSDLAAWTFRYVNFIYEHGGHSGNKLPKRFTESVYWHLRTRSRHEDAYFFAHASGRRGLDYPFGADQEAFDEHKRQEERSIDFSIESNIDKIDDPTAHSHERISLTFDADAVVIGGSYWWHGSDRENRPAPEASFASLQEAHEATVSARGAIILQQFRDAVIEPQSGVRLSNVWNHDLSVTPPSEIVPVPKSSIDKA
jgi:hypothetical protein